MFNKNLKQIITMTALAVVPLFGYGYDVVRVTPSTGSYTDFKLSGHPVLTIGDEHFTMTTDDNKEGIEFDASLDHSFTFIADAGVESIGNDGAMVSLNGNTLSLSGFPANSPVRIYTAGGVLVSEMIVGADGSAEISLDDLQHGVYLLNSSQIQFKFSKR